MKRTIKLSLCLSLLCCGLQGFGQLTSKQYKDDFLFLWKTIDEDYAYWDKKQTNWQRVKEFYSPRFDTVRTNSSFILLMEQVLNELYDHHISMGVNTAASQRLVPSGADLWCSFNNGEAMIDEVRAGSAAEAVGLKAGMKITKLGGIPIISAVNNAAPKCLKSPDPEALNYTLRILLAGIATNDRSITIIDKGVEKTLYPDRKTLSFPTNANTFLEVKKLAGNIGYIRINDRLWDNGLIPVFDSAFRQLRGTKGMILDLRNTPGGGDTTVARAILGSFIRKEAFYQKHELTAEERSYGVKRSWQEIVSPRKDVYNGKLVVLVNHWTGSVGEGIAIGFDALKVKVVGTPMAQLNGANYSYQMPSTRFGFSFPVEKLFHVNGTPRERFIPPILIDPLKAKPGTDLFIETALRLLK